MNQRQETSFEIALPERFHSGQRILSREIFREPRSIADIDERFGNTALVIDGIVKKLKNMPTKKA